MGENYHKIHEMSGEVVKAVRQILLTPSRLFSGLVFSAPHLTDEDLQILTQLIELQFDYYEHRDLLIRTSPYKLSVDLVGVPGVNRVRTLDRSVTVSHTEYDTDWTTTQ